MTTPETQIAPDPNINQAEASLAVQEATANPEVDFSAAESTSTAVISPSNGTHLCRIVEFAPVVNQDTGIVERWSFTLDAAEPIPDNQKPPQEIPEGSRLGTFSVFVAPSQYRSQAECIKDAKVMSESLNGIVRDVRNDPGFKSADAAWAALDARAKRPMFTGQPPIMDAELEYYAPHIGTLVLATINTKIGKDGVARTNLVALAAKDGPRVRKGGK